jgi:hypothetical protein
VVRDPSPLTNGWRAFLNTFDIVVLGDGSFEYVKTLLDDILQIKPEPTPAKRPGLFERGLLGVTHGVDIF